MGFFDFFKNNSSHVVDPVQPTAELKKTEVVSQPQEKRNNDEPILEYKELTIRTFSNAIYLGAKHGIDKEHVSLQNIDYGERNYKLSFDEGFYVLLKIGKNANDVLRLEVILKDKNHHFVPYKLKNGLSLEKEDKLIQWEHDGPWVAMIERKTKELFELYHQKVNAEKRKKEQTLEYFKKKFSENQSETSKVLSYYDLTHVLNEANKWDLLLDRNRQENPYRRTTIDKYDAFVIGRVEGRNETNVTIELEENGHQLQLFHGSVKSDGLLNFDDVYWVNALKSMLKELTEKINEKNTEKEKQVVEHFTKKYKIKSIFN